MTRKISRIFAVLLTVLMAMGCSSYDAPFNPQPSLEVEEAKDITRNEATIAGKISYNGGQGLSLLSFEWRVADGNAISTPVLSPDDNGKVEFRLQGLTPGKTYFYALHGNNGRVNMSSPETQFTTMPNVIPTVSPLTSLAKGPASLIASFVIEDNGGEDIIEAGCHIRNITTGSTSKAIANISQLKGDTIVMTMTGLDKLASLEVTPYAANTIGEAKGIPLMVTTDNSISISEPGTLSQLMGDDRYGFTSLSFSGQLNGSDIRILREMAGMDFYGNDTGGTLNSIDLTDADIVEGGNNYIQSRATQDNVVGYGMFQNLQGLKSVKLPNSCTTIEEQAFKDCHSLSVITIPANTVSVSTSDGCPLLTAINVSAANSRYQSIDGVLFNADATEILWFPLGKDGDYTLPSTVKSIGEYAFRNCHITNFVMPDNITEIGMAAFYGSSVETVTLSDNLATIPQATFQNCFNLKRVVIGKATSLIGTYVFDGCPLTDIVISATIPPVCYEDSFRSSYDLVKLCTLHVPQSSLQRYRLHQRWSKFENIIAQ